MAGFQFDPKINLGNVLTFAGFCAVGFSFWAATDKRVAVLEEARINQVQVDRRQDDGVAEMKRLNREDFRDINTKLDQLLIAVQRKP